jgi:hypothetical protein
LRFNEVLPVRHVWETNRFGGSATGGTPKLCLVKPSTEIRGSCKVERDLQPCASPVGSMFIAGLAALRHRASSRHWYLGLALGSYIVLLGILLAWSHFLPYGSDNNESFAMFTGARNLLRFGFGDAMGLVDEANAIDPVAHPYVYTHEGNFPRLPVYLLIRLGLAGIEGQIALVALLVGSATVYLCFTFFSRIAGDLFAFLTCAVLATDYLMFMQWEVNTYRVWHGFFFFACLLCVQSLGPGRFRRVGVPLFLTCVALFYFEVVFAIFAVATSLCYGLLIFWKDRGLVYRAALIAGAGAIVAVGGLFAQSVAYLGLETASRDLQLTVLNRNFYVQSGAEGAALQTSQFFLQHHIVYWRDNPDTRGYLRIGSFLRTFAKFGLFVDTPYLVSLMWVVTAAWLVAAFARVKVLILSPALPRPKPISLSGLGLGAFFICGGAAYTINRLGLSGADFAPIWLGAIEGYFRHRVLLAGLTGAFLLGLLFIVDGGWQLSRLHNDRCIMGVFRYLGAAIIAYTFVYLLSPGYLMQGYLVRYVPLAVFITDVWIALFFYMLVTMVRASHAAVVIQGREVFRGAIQRGGDLRILVRPHLMRALAVILLVFAVLYWARVQAVYVAAVPLSDYLFMRQFAQEPYRGATFISDAYAGPLAYFAGTWAYADDFIYENLYVEKSGRVTQLISGDRLWEADRDTNTSYLHPQYYVCIRTPTLYMAATFVSLRPGERLSQCSSEPIVHSAREGLGPYRNTVVAEDQGPWDMWAIVRLDRSNQLAFAGSTFNASRRKEADLVQARQLASAVEKYYAEHGCYPSVSARSFGAMPKGLDPYVGSAWPRLQMYAAFDHGWHWVGSGAAAFFVGVIPYSVWKADTHGFVSVVSAHRARMC